MLHTSSLNITVVAFKVLPLGAVLDKTMAGMTGGEKQQQQQQQQQTGLKGKGVKWTKIILKFEHVMKVTSFSIMDLTIASFNLFLSETDSE
jgi:hypothetical protein